MLSEELEARRQAVKDAVERHGVLAVSALTSREDAPLPGGLDLYVLVTFDEDRRPAGLGYLRELLAIEDELCALLGIRVGVGDAQGTSNWILFDHRAREEATVL
jgi:hypothetical protein